MAKFTKRLRTHLSASNLIAVVALVVAIGGVSYAATTLPKKSVGPKQLRVAAVTEPKIQDGAVTTPKLGNAAVSSEKLASAAVSTEKVADNAVNGAKLAANSVGASEIAADAVTGDAFFRAATVNVNPPSVSAEAGDNCTSVDTTVGGVAPGDHVFASPESLNAGLVMFPLASSTPNQVNLRVCNLGQNLVDQPAIDVFILVIR